MLRLLTMLCASKKASVPFIFLLTPFLLFAQATKKGKVVDDKGQGVPGITISL